LTRITTPEAFARRFDVSRETLARLETYAALLARWTPRINLVSAATLPDLGHRHVADSAQLLALAPRPRLWLDLGSGAGFPGLVIAILAPDIRVRLVESDQRKCAFLRRVSEDTGTAIDILPERIEALPPQAADVISARALAPLTQLLTHVEKHLAPGGIGLFPKGRTVHNEIAEAERAWRFPCWVHPSLTDPEAAIVETGAPSRV
jgi:16S rRNA (guanine527-N7)-methyltransferase